MLKENNGEGKGVQLSVFIVNVKVVALEISD